MKLEYRRKEDRYEYENAGRGEAAQRYEPGTGRTRVQRCGICGHDHQKYPIDTPEHIRAAWSYIHHKDNAAKYEAADVNKIKHRIEQAAKKRDIELHQE